MRDVGAPFICPMIPKLKTGAAAAGVAAGLGAGSAQASDGGIFGFTWGDVGNFFVDFFTPGGVGEVGRGSDIVPSAPAGYMPSQGSYGGAAGGGFVLYPNKANTNMMRSVYSK